LNFQIPQHEKFSSARRYLEKNLKNEVSGLTFLHNQKNSQKSLTNEKRLGKIMPQG
jgi:hypothetical protein